jgi:cell division septation protein DedD
MSRLFAALKTIQNQREAAVHEYTRVAARMGSATPVAQTPPRRRWSSGTLVGALGFGAGVAVAFFAIVPSRSSSPLQGDATRAVAAKVEAPPPGTTSDAGAIVKAVVTDPPQPSVAAGVPAAKDSATASGPLDQAMDGAASGEFWVQIGAFKFRENAARLRVRLEDERRRVVVRPGRPGALPWVLAVGPYADEGAAREAESVLAGEGFPGFVVRGGG